MNDANTRGEVTITLDGAEYVMRPSYEAIEAIEAQTGKGILALIQGAQEGNLTLAQTAIIVAECMKAWGRQQIAAGEASPEARSAAGAQTQKVARLIHEAGLMTALPRVVIVLVAAATGGVNSAGEPKPATETSTPDAG
jgi:hypothetical protein